MTQAIRAVLASGAPTRQHKPLPPVSNDARTAGPCDLCGLWDGDLRAGVGSCCVSRQPQCFGFPASIDLSQILTETDIADLAEVGPPKGEPLPMLPARRWLPCNDQLAVQLGHAQAVLRQLDDQRALVTSLSVHPDLILIDLLRPPLPGTVHGLVTTGEFPARQFLGQLVGSDADVMLRWPDAVAAS